MEKSEKIAVATTTITEERNRGASQTLEEIIEEDNATESSGT